MVKAIPITGIKHDPNYESDVSSFSCNGDAIVVDVEISEGEFYRVTFGQQIWAFRYMEEGDLTYYWQSRQFEESFLVYEVTEGGWLSKEQSSIDILGIARSGNWLREWFVPTRNFSVTVLTNSQPKIERSKHA